MTYSEQVTEYLYLTYSSGITLENLSCILDRDNLNYREGLRYIILIDKYCIPRKTFEATKISFIEDL